MRPRRRGDEKKDVDGKGRVEKGEKSKKAAEQKTENRKERESKTKVKI